MNPEKLSLLGISFLSVIGLAILVFRQNPYSADPTVKALFFLTLFFIFLGILSISFKNLRRGLLAAAEIVAAFGFNRLGILNWYMAAFLLALFFVVELLASKGQYTAIVKEVSKN